MCNAQRGRTGTAGRRPQGFTGYDIEGCAVQGQVTLLPVTIRLVSQRNPFSSGWAEYFKPEYGRKFPSPATHDLCGLLRENSLKPGSERSFCS